MFVCFMLAQAVTLPSPCFTDKLVCCRSKADLFFVHTFYKFDRGSSWFQSFTGSSLLLLILHADERIASSDICLQGGL